MPSDIDLYEGSEFRINLVLRYGENFDGGTEGNPIPRSALSRVYFYIKKPRGTSILVTKSDSNGSIDTPSEIEWTDEDNGLLTVKILPSDTSGNPAKSSIFELWGVLVSTGQLVILDRGTINILDSIVS